MKGLSPQQDPAAIVSGEGGDVGQADLLVAGGRKSCRTFSWTGLIAALAASSAIMFAFGLLMDNTLRMFGIGISVWRDALWDAAMAFLTSCVVAPIFWRIGLVTFPQYLLGAFALMVPLAIVFTLVLAQFADVNVEVLGVDSVSFPNQSFAISAYVRLIRGAFYVPVFLGSFYWIYHIVLGMAPRGHGNG